MSTDGVDARVLRELAGGIRCDVDHPRARPDVRGTPGLMLKWLEPCMYVCMYFFLLERSYVCMYVFFSPREVLCMYVCMYVSM